MFCPQIAIEQAPSQPAAGPGVCAACLPNTCGDLQPWINATLAAGFSKVYVYQADQPEATQQPSVSYFQAELSEDSLPAALSTLSTECIHRHRNSHAFLAVVQPNVVVSVAVKPQPLVRSLPAADLLGQSSVRVEDIATAMRSCQSCKLVKSCPFPSSPGLQWFPVCSSFAPRPCAQARADQLRGCLADSASRLSLLMRTCLKFQPRPRSTPD